VGNIRDALFKHLLARHFNGTNILRIEDTDRTRYVEGAEEDIVASLKWLNIDFQEGVGFGGEHGPYRQSERKEAGIYAHWINVLMEAGHAYKAFETSEELTEMREFQTINKQPIGYYGGVWRDATPAQVEEAECAGKPFVIRQRIPRNQTIVIDDYIRGRVEWDSNTVDDPVLIKADGMPTYHFAAMVDDHLMDITHIMRGEEWISSAPKHACLFDSFGWTRPIFVHCPVIKGKDGSKLSKRHGDTRCLDYRSAGYLPGALANFIALIGWSPGGDRELMSMDELIEAFTLDGLQPSPGVFDMDKLRWMNGNYIRHETIPGLVKTLEWYSGFEEVPTYFQKEGHESPETIATLGLLRESLTADRPLAEAAIRLEQERVTTLADFGPACAFFFQPEPPMDEKATEKWFGQPHVGDLYSSLIASLSGKDSISVEECEALIKGYAEAQGMDKIGPVVHPTRVALTGKTSGPGLFELMSALGPHQMIARLERVKGLLG
jgi:glutamyl-tRNA synthetase